MNSMVSNIITDSSHSIHTSAFARRRLKRRYAKELRFKVYGIIAVLTAIGFLFLLLSTIVGKGIPAFTYNYMTLDLDFSKVNKENRESVDYNTIIKDSLSELAPYIEGRRDRRLLNGLVSSGANVLLRRDVLADQTILDQEGGIKIPLSDFADLYVKGLVSEDKKFNGEGNAQLDVTTESVKVHLSDDYFNVILDELRLGFLEELKKLRTDLEKRHERLNLIHTQMRTIESALKTSAGNEKQQLEENFTKLIASQRVVDLDIALISDQIASLEYHIENPSELVELNDILPSYLIYINGGVIKVEKIGPAEAIGTVLIPLQSSAEAKNRQWLIQEIVIPQSNRKFSDKEIALIEKFSEQGLVSTQFNKIFFTAGASREPEMAGIWGAVVGSFLTILVTLALAFPIGVAAAIYLEEFAPKNRITQLIEVNINNLAAVPSIVFGLLGLGVFLNIFGFPRSAPIVGGMVLALMTLPTIIIASRAALNAVPPSIREGALGIGASKQQMVLHHVLPLAMPGIFTGTIIGMAQALGESAPLLMIGMVAFIVDIPGGFFDSATALPVQIFMWADFPEPAFQQKTSAAIMVLLVFLIAMNGLAIVLRKRFERRW